MLGETPVATPVTPAAAVGGLFQPQPQAERNSPIGPEEMDTGLSSCTAKVTPDPLGRFSKMI